jgi:hypothetical protein
MNFRFSIFLNLVRSLFPKWSFFDQVAFGFELEFKLPDSTSWEPVSFKGQRSFLNLFSNPDGNLAILQGNILDHFVQDIQRLQAENPALNSKEVQALTTFKMITALLETKLKEYEHDSPAVQFKIVARSPDSVLDFYFSDWIQVNQL